MEIIKEINKIYISFELKNGKRPKRIYLGRYEVECLKKEFVSFSDIRFSFTRLKMLELDVYEVAEDNHLFMV